MGLPSPRRRPPAGIAFDPNRWASWWVNLGEAEKVDGDGAGGRRVRIEFEGPITGWQTWDYEPRGDGATLVTAEIEYNVPGKAIGKFADRLVVERLQERARQQTLENLKLMAESSG
jgi:hypothetical protein